MSTLLNPCVRAAMLSMFSISSYLISPYGSTPCSSKFLLELPT